MLVVKSFPRMCGVVPDILTAVHAAEVFSLHVRGCSVKMSLSCTHNSHFPACAGLFLNAMVFGSKRHAFPRMCGVVPTFQTVFQTVFHFSRVCGVVPH